MYGSKASNLVFEIAYLSGKFDLNVECDGKYITAYNEGKELRVSVSDVAALRGMRNAIHEAFGDCL